MFLFSFDKHFEIEAVMREFELFIYIFLFFLQVLAIPTAADSNEGRFYNVNYISYYHYKKCTSSGHIQI